MKIFAVHFNFPSRSPSQRRDFTAVSLRDKIINLIIVTAVILGTLSVTISSIIYTQNMDNRYTESCESVVGMMLDVIDGDSIERYLSTGEKDDAYYATEAEFERIKSHTIALKYMYVYRILEDGCQVVSNGYGFEPRPRTRRCDTVRRRVCRFSSRAFREARKSSNYCRRRLWLASDGLSPIPIPQASACHAAADVSMETLFRPFIFIMRFVALLFGSTIVNCFYYLVCR